MEMSTLDVVGTIVAALSAAITAWMAIETRRMSRTAVQALQLEQMPILGFRGLRTQFETDVTPTETSALSSIRVGMELFNAGRIAVKYELKSMTLTFAGRTADPGHFSSRGGRILPGSSTVFWHSTMPLEPSITKFPAKGRVRCDFEYFDESGSQVHSLADVVEYTIKENAKGGWRVSWVHVDDKVPA